MALDEKYDVPLFFYVSLEVKQMMSLVLRPSGPHVIFWVLPSLIFLSLFCLSVVSGLGSFVFPVTRVQRRSRGSRPLFPKNLVNNSRCFGMVLTIFRKRRLQKYVRKLFINGSRIIQCL